MGNPVSRSRPLVEFKLGADRSDVLFHAGNQAGGLYDERNRIAEFLVAEDHQKSCFVSKR